MADVSKRLRKVEYSRNYSSEKQAGIQLVGDSRWMRDIELILEDEWSGVKCYPDGASAKTALDSQNARMIIVEPKAYGDDTFRWLEAAIQGQMKPLLIAPEDHNQFEWMSISRRAAGLDVGSIMLSLDSKHAAREMSEILNSSDSLKTTRWMSDIQFIKAAFQGYRYAVPDSEDSPEKSLFSLVGDEFAISSEHLAIASVLIDSLPLWKKPKQVGTDLEMCYRRIEREIAGSEVSKVLQVVQSTVSDFNGQTFSETSWKQSIVSTGFGILSRRKLEKKYSDVENVLQFSSGVRTLKIA